MKLYKYMTETAIQLYGNISTITLVNLSFFVIPTTLHNQLFSVTFSNSSICRTLLIPVVILLSNLGLIVQIKLFQLIKSYKIKIDFHQ